MVEDWRIYALYTILMLLSMGDGDGLPGFCRSGDLLLLLIDWLIYLPVLKTATLHANF